MRAVQIELAREVLQERGCAREPAGCQRLGLFVAGGGGVELVPGGVGQAIGQRLPRAHRHQRFGGDRQPPVPAGHVEVVHDVAEKVAVGERAHARHGGQFEAQAVLRAVGARLHPHFHDAFADRRRVRKPRDVMNRVLDDARPGGQRHDAIAASIE